MTDHERLVERLHATLVEEIRTRRPEYLSGPFTVAEIYQDLVPYRTHRDRIGAAMNGDYEHALLGLLAGLGGFLSLESEAARRRLASELESNNPNTGIFREYAALDVRLNPARIPDAPARAERGDAPDELTAFEPSPPELPLMHTSIVEPPTAASPTAETAAPSRPHGDPLADGTRREERNGAAEATVPASAPEPKDAAPRGAAPAAAVESCRWCRETLPQKASLRFCPHCGMDVKLIPCPSCGDEVEPGWRFCIACGENLETGD